MTDRGYNPLNEIFLKTPEGQLTEELENINNIKLFFEFLIDDSISSDEKESVLIDITSKIHTNRYISEFFYSNINLFHKKIYTVNHILNR